MDVVEDSVNCECTSMGAMNTAGLRTRWSCSTFPFFQQRLFSGRLLRASTRRFRGRLRSFGCCFPANVGVRCKNFFRFFLLFLLYMNTSNFPLPERSFEFEFRFCNFTFVRFSTFAHELSHTTLAQVVVRIVSSMFHAQCLF